jgi:hemoglobin
MSATEKITIAGWEQVKMMVNTFYDKVRQDDLIGPIFNERIQDWGPHLEKMYRFWNAVLFQQPGYFGAPFAPHATMPIAAEHFERWVKLFKANIEEHFTGDVAEEALWRAGKMADLFRSKKEYLDKSNMENLF